MSGYWRYIAERLVVFVATVAISLTIVFILPRIVPGDPMTAVMSKLGEVGGNLGGQALVADYTRRFNLDKPPLEQYAGYLMQLSRGDMGYSIASFPTTVSELLWQAVPWTIGL